jgi:hypothetical protein
LYSDSAIPLLDTGVRHDKYLSHYFLWSLQKTGVELCDGDESGPEQLDWRRDSLYNLGPGKRKNQLVVSLPVGFQFPSSYYTLTLGNPISTFQYIEILKY